MGGKCGSHDAMCEQITATRIAVARVEETIKPIPQLVDDVQIIKNKVSNMAGFVAGVSAAVSLITTLVTIWLTISRGSGRL